MITSCNCCFVTVFLQTREELRNSLEDEMRAFSVDRDLSNNHVIAWNHSEFEVVYPSLSEEIKIGEGLETCLVTLKSRVL